jgi:ABC-type multidrug transport system fused ATPase/permease subunit
MRTNDLTIDRQTSLSRRRPLPINGPVISDLPYNFFLYIFRTSGHHQMLLAVLTTIVFLLDVVPLELQRRVINDLVKHRAFPLVLILGAVYAAVVLAQGGAKLAVNVYRGWLGERAKRDLRRRIQSVVDLHNGSAAAEAEGIAAAMIVAEVEPLGGFVGESISEPLLQIGSLAAVFAYIVHLDPWMALAAFLFFLPQLAFVPLLQQAINRRTGLRVRVLRQLGIDVIAPAGNLAAEDREIDRAFELDMGIFRLKFTMNFLMNLSNHFQIVAGLLLGGW